MVLGWDLGSGLGRPLGSLALLGYVLAQFVFYLHGQVLLAFAGNGLPYSLAHAHDAIVWVVFVIGDVNFVAAALTLVYLFRNRATAGGARSRKPEGRDR